MALSEDAFDLGKVGVIFFGSNKENFNKEKEHIHPQKNRQRHGHAKADVLRQHRAQKKRDSIVTGAFDRPDACCKAEIGRASCRERV